MRSLEERWIWNQRIWFQCIDDSLVKLYDLKIQNCFLRILRNLKEIAERERGEAEQMRVFSYPTIPELLCLIVFL